MLKNLIVLPDGTELFSGTGTVNALQSVTLTQCVNVGTELTLGSACAGMLEATVITPAGDLAVAAGTELHLYKVDDEGVRTKAGVFYAEKPTRPSANRCELTAYDAVSRLDKELGPWVESLNGWPYTLLGFAKMVCATCGLTLANESLPNGAWKVGKFSPGSVTGRQLLQWVGQACGRFCRATVDGEIEFAWYTARDITLTPNGELPVFALSFKDYQVAPVDKVQIRLTETDVGAVYGTGSNGYVITGNPLLLSDTLAPLQDVAQELYSRLQAVTYTPCRVTLPANREIGTGDVLRVKDTNGKTLSFCVMKKMQTGYLEILECTGSATRDSVTATNNAKAGALNGKVLELQMSMEGIRAENRDRDAQSATLEMTTRALTLQLQGIQDDGVSRVSTATGYTFDENGMTVEKAGREIKTQITEDGMTVYKNTNAVLTANSAGVDAVDLHASTYLAVGGRSRFENCGTDRTGCFWIGG